MSRGTIKLAIVNHYLFVRRLLKSYLSQQDEMTVVVQAANFRELFIKLRSDQVDVIISEPKIPGEDVSLFIETFQYEYPAARILMLSTDTDIHLISDMLNLGICGIVSNDDEPEELAAAVKSIYVDGVFRNKLLTEALYFNKMHNPRINSGQYLPDERERRLLKLLWEDNTNKEIAKALFLSVRSVEKIRQDLKEKLGVKTTLGLIRFALSEKIIASDAIKENALK